MERPMEGALVQLQTLKTWFRAQIHRAAAAGDRQANVLRWTERSLWAIGALCLGVVAYAIIDAHWFSYVQGRRLDQALAARQAAGSGADHAPGADGASAADAPAAAGSGTNGEAAPASGADNLSGFLPTTPPPLAPQEPDEGSLIGRIQVPRLGLSELVLQGVSTTTLRRGVGHIPETALPGGQSGNVGLAGHRDTVFTQLKGIRKDDVISLETMYGTSRYAVDWTRIVQPQEVAVLAPDPGHAELTLVTCYPFHYIGSAPQRFIVRAHRLDGDALADSGLYQRNRWWMAPLFGGAGQARRRRHSRDYVEEAQRSPRRRGQARHYRFL
jgi:sortase A